MADQSREEEKNNQADEVHTNPAKLILHLLRYLPCVRHKQLGLSNNSAKPQSCTHNWDTWLVLGLSLHSNLWENRPFHLFCPWEHRLLGTVGECVYRVLKSPNRRLLTFHKISSIQYQYSMEDMSVYHRSLHGPIFPRLLGGLTEYLLISILLYFR